MKREIKFRAWITTDVDDEDNDIKSMTYDLAFTKYAPINELINKQENLMQFTGLQDKNGVDIYEGDILTKWDGLKKKVFFSDKHFNFQLSHLDNRGFCDTLSFWNQKSTEVIGNIYENPELLSTPTAVL